MKFNKALIVLMLAGVLSLTGCTSLDIKDNNPAVNKESENKDSTVKEEPKDKTDNDKETDEEEIISDNLKAQEFILGEWANEAALHGEEEMKFAMAYYTEFKADGTVHSYGYRNIDNGKYEIVDNNTVKAVFKENYFDNQGGEGNNKPMDNYEYSVVYTLDYDNNVLNAEYSEEFYEACISNASDGILERLK